MSRIDTPERRAAMNTLRAAAIEREQAEQHVIEAVALARDEGASWAAIAESLGRASRGQVQVRYQPLIEQLRGSRRVA